MQVEEEEPALDTDTQEQVVLEVVLMVALANAIMEKQIPAEEEGQDPLQMEQGTGGSGVAIIRWGY